MSRSISTYKVVPEFVLRWTLSINLTMPVTRSGQFPVFPRESLSGLAQGIEGASVSVLVFIVVGVILCMCSCRQFYLYEGALTPLFLALACVGIGLAVIKWKKRSKGPNSSSGKVTRGAASIPSCKMSPDASYHCRRIQNKL